MAYRDKKILDIIPPDRKGATDDFVISNILKKSNKSRYLFLLIILVVVLVFALSYFSLLKVTVEILPRYEKVIKNNDVFFDVKIKTPDYSNRQLPIVVVELAKDYQENFVPSGTVTKEEKAKGTVKLYNSTNSAQVLVKDTRLLSSEGKLFRLTSRVAIPASTKSDPGTVDAEVIAVEPGEGYNIGATIFSIPGFAGTAKYTSFYAKSFKPMAGGYIGKVGQVQSADLGAAKESVTKALLRIKEELVENEKEKGLMPINGIMTAEVKNIVYSAKDDELIDSFSASGRIEIVFIAVKNNDLDLLAEEMLNSKNSNKTDESPIEGSKKIRPNSVKVEIDPIDIDLKTQKGTARVTVSGEIYREIGGEVIKNAIKGRAISEAKAYLESQSAVDMARITIKPFLIGSIPNDVSRIDVVIEK